MIVRLNEADMLGLWRTAAGLEPVRRNGTVTISGGIDYDKILLERMRPWYLKLLDSCDPAKVCLSDIARESMVYAGSEGHGVIMLPDGCRQVVSVKMKGWPASRRPESSEEFASSHGHAMNPYSNPQQCSGATIDGRLLRVTLPEGTEAEIEQLIAVIDPGEGVYELDESALGDIPREFPTDY